MSAWKQTLLASGLLIATCSGAAEPGYIDAQLAITKPEQSGSGLVVAVAGGIPVPERRSIFLEGEISTTIVSPKRQGAKLSYTQVGGWGVYRQLIDKRFALHGKAGILYQYSKLEQEKANRGAAIGFAIGATIHSSRSLSYLVEATSVLGQLDLTRISAGIRYHIR